jgi:hypothetical protein
MRAEIEVEEPGNRRERQRSPGNREKKYNCQRKSEKRTNNIKTKGNMRKGQTI